MTEEKPVIRLLREMISTQKEIRDAIKPQTPSTSPSPVTIHDIVNHMVTCPDCSPKIKKFVEDFITPKVKECIGEECKLIRTEVESGKLAKKEETRKLFKRA